MSEKSLIKIDEISPLEVFVSGKYQVILDSIKEKSVIENPDINTGSGRQIIRSVAAKVAASKSLLEKVGKNLADHKRKEIADELERINSARSAIKIFLSDLKNNIRRPLTDWENEKKEAETKEELKAEILRLHGEALEDNRVFDDKKQLVIDKKKLEDEKIRLVAEEKARENLQKKEDQKVINANARTRDAEIEKGIAEKEKREAEEEKKLAFKKVGQARQRNLSAIGIDLDVDTLSNMSDAEWSCFFDGKNSEYKTEQNRIFTETLKRERKEVEQKAKAAADQKESDRLAKEKADCEERERKAADTEHRKKINNEALDSLLTILQKDDYLSDKPQTIFEEIGKSIIIAIIQGKIRNVTINY